MVHHELGSVQALDVDHTGVAVITGSGVFRMPAAGGDLDLIDDSPDVCDLALVDGAVYASFEAQVVRRVDAEGELGVTFRNEPPVCPVLGRSDDTLFMGFEGFSSGAIAWAPVGAAKLPEDAFRQVEHPVIRVTGDDEAIYFVEASREMPARPVFSLKRSPREGGDTMVLADVEGSPSNLVLDATSVFWSERRGQSIVILAVDQQGGPVRTLAVEDRGCGNHGQVAVAQGHVYFGSHESPAGDGCGGTYLNTLSRVPIEGGAIEDVLGKPSMGFIYKLSIPDGRIFFVDGDTRLGLVSSETLRSVPLP